MDRINKLFFFSLSPNTRGRKLLPTPDEKNKTTICHTQYCNPSNYWGFCPPPPCNSTCPGLCSSFPPYLHAEYPPPAPPPPTHHNDLISTLLITLASVLGGFLLFLSFCMCIVKYRTNLRRSSVELNDTHEDFIDVNRGPVFDNPIWFITRAGLQDSIINSITVCKYKRGEGLIEGTECSVCLSEFEDDETLRLLPKCSHAFHLPCIDTWLRSHTNCPLCRANIVFNTSGSSFTATIPSLNDSNTGNEIQIENPHSFRGLGSDRIDDGAQNDIRVGIEDEGNSMVEDGRNDIEITKEGVSSSHVNCGFRVLSDLVNSSVMDNVIQPRRRSVSMDSSLASAIFLSVANAFPEESLGVSNNQLVQVKKSNSGFHFKKASGNKNMFKLIGSSSMGRSLKKGPISMKRSFSSGGKFLLSTSS